MIGTKWYYVERGVRKDDPAFAIKTATVIAETPRKWTLREDGFNDEWSRNVDPMDSFHDHQIFKSGGDAREGRGWRGKLSRTFFATKAAAQGWITQAQAEGWRVRHVHHIAQAVARIKDPALLSK